MTKLQFILLMIAWTIAQAAISSAIVLMVRPLPAPPALEQQS